MNYKEVRLKAGLTQKQVAMITGYTQPNICHFEAGRIKNNEYLHDQYQKFQSNLPLLLLLFGVTVLLLVFFYSM